MRIWNKYNSYRILIIIFVQYCVVVYSKLCYFIFMVGVNEFWHFEIIVESALGLTPYAKRGWGTKAQNIIFVLTFGIVKNFVIWWRFPPDQGPQKNIASGPGDYNSSLLRTHHLFWHQLFGLHWLSKSWKIGRFDTA